MARTPVSDKPLVWIDTETTGLDPVENEVIEIAIIRPLDNGSELTFCKKLRLERPETAHPKALEVNGYTPETWAEAEPQEVVWREIAERGLLENCIIAGHNVGFDARMIQESFKRHNIERDGRPVRIDYHMYDTVTLALEHLQPYVKSVSLGAVCVALGIPVRNAHSALADARMAMEVSRVLRTAPNVAGWADLIRERLAAWEEAGKPKAWGVS